MSVSCTPKQAAIWLEWALRRKDTKDNLPKSVELIIRVFEKFWKGEITEADLVRRCGYAKLPSFFDKFVKYGRSPK